MGSGGGQPMASGDANRDGSASSGEEAGGGEGEAWRRVRKSHWRAGSRRRLARGLDRGTSPRTRSERTKHGPARRTMLPVDGREGHRTDASTTNPPLTRARAGAPAAPVAPSLMDARAGRHSSDEKAVAPITATPLLPRVRRRSSSDGRESRPPPPPLPLRRMR